jgi:hypothetical protein
MIIMDSETCQSGGAMPQNQQTSSKQGAVKMDSIRFVLPADQKKALQKICIEKGYNLSAILRKHVEQIISEETKQPSKKERSQANNTA